MLSWELEKQEHEGGQNQMIEMGIVVLVCVNIAAVAYSYGKLSQKVDDLCRRVTRLENKSNPGIEDKRK